MLAERIYLLEFFFSINITPSGHQEGCLFELVNLSTSTVCLYSLDSYCRLDTVSLLLPFPYFCCRYLPSVSTKISFHYLACFIDAASQRLEYNFCNGWLHKSFHLINHNIIQIQFEKLNVVYCFLCLEGIKYPLLELIAKQRDYSIGITISYYHRKRSILE